MLSTFADGALFGERHGEAPLEILALHGWGRSHRDFATALSPVDAAPLNAVALDLPGFGASPTPTKAFSSQDYADAVRPVLEEARKPVLLVGHSHGGRVALKIAACLPEAVSGIVLVAAPVLHRSDSRRPALHYRLLKRANRLKLFSDARMEEARRRFGSADYAAAEGVMRDTLVTVVNESFEAELSALRCPVALLWGAEDREVPVEVAVRAKALIGTDLEPDDKPPSSLRVLEGIGHLVPTTAPASLRESILGLLS